MTGITFLMNRVIAGDREALGEGHRRIIEEAHRRLSSLYGLEGKTIAVLFRVGVADPPTCRSLRYPRETVVLRKP